MVSLYKVILNKQGKARKGNGDAQKVQLRKGAKKVDLTKKVNQ